MNMEISEKGVFGFSIIGTLYLFFTIISIIAYIKAYIRYKRAKGSCFTDSYKYYLDSWIFGKCAIWWWWIFNSLILLIGISYLITKVICKI